MPKRGIWFMDKSVKPHRIVVYAHGRCVNVGQYDASMGCAYYFRPENPYNDQFSCDDGGIQTGNRAQLLAIHYGLEALLENTQYNHVQVRTNSDYAIGSICTWFDNWEENGWVTKSGHPVANKDTIVKLYDLVGEFKSVTFLSMSKYADDGYFQEVRRMSKEAVQDNETEESEDVYLDGYKVAFISGLQALRIF